MSEKEIVHTPEEYDFPDSLYQDHWEDADAYGIVDDNGELLACIEVCPENWSNRLMVTELWVCPEEIIPEKVEEIEVNDYLELCIIEP